MCYARRQRSSWARIKLSKSLYQNILPDDLTFLLSSLALSFFYFCFWVVFSFKEFSRSVSHISLCFVLLSCCSIFKDHFRPRFRGDLVIIPHPNRFVKPFSKSFLSFFQRLLPTNAVSFSPRFRRELDYYTTFPSLCQHFFSFFSPFFSLLSLRTIFVRHFVRHLGHKYNILYKMFGSYHKIHSIILGNPIKKETVLQALYSYSLTH